MPTIEDLGSDDLPAPTPSGDAGTSAKVPTLAGLEPDVDEEEDDDIDESLAERLWGLTEMFPDSVRSLTTGLLSYSISGAKTAYQLGRSGMWVAASSATILALPIMFETERAQMEEQQLAQQRQLLLGPNAAVSGGAGGGLMPQVVPPAQRS